MKVSNSDSSAGCMYCRIKTEILTYTYDNHLVCPLCWDMRVLGTHATIFLDKDISAVARKVLELVSNAAITIDMHRYAPTIVSTSWEVLPTASELFRIIQDSFDSEEKFNMLSEKIRINIPRVTKLTVQNTEYFIRRVYFQSTLDLLHNNQLDSIAKALFIDADAVNIRPDQNIRMKTMLFLSMQGGDGTGLHWDITRGLNVAFSLTPGVTGPLAYWLFIPPWEFEEFIAFVQSGNCVKVVRDKFEEAIRIKTDFPLLSADEMFQLHRQVPNLVRIVSQSHGQVVHVAPGWIHSVVNVLPNWKLAFDFERLEEFPLYAYYRKIFGSGFFQDRCPEDYVTLDAVIKDNVDMMTKGHVPDSLTQAT